MMDCMYAFSNEEDMVEEYLFVEDQFPETLEKDRNRIMGHLVTKPTQLVGYTRSIYENLVLGQMNTAKALLSLAKDRWNELTLDPEEEERLADLEKILAG